MSPVLALAGLAAIGLLVTRLPRPAWRRVPRLDPVLAASAPLVLLGVILGPGPGIELLDRSVLRALAPVTALAIGWTGAALGAGFEWRYVRRIPRRAWLLALLSATGAFSVIGLAAWALIRAVPALAAAWTPRLPAILTLAAVAQVSAPGAVALMARAAGIRKTAARTLSVAAALESAGGALFFIVPVALHHPHPFAAIVLTIGSAALVGMAFLSLIRVWPARADIGFALLATLVFGAGVGYAAQLSPFLVCALAAVLMVNALPPHGRHAVRRLLAHGERPVLVVFLVIVGALLRLPTAWILLAVPLLAALRVAAKWAAVRYGGSALHLAPFPPNVGLGTVAQGSAAIALGVNFFLIHSDPGDAAILTTVVLGVACALLAAPLLLALATRAPVAAATPTPLTPVGEPAELSVPAPAPAPAPAPLEWPR